MVSRSKMIKKSMGKYILLFSWDISNPKSSVRLEKSEELRRLMKLAELNHWEVDLKKLLSEEYKTVVLTDLNLEILYVNQGFHAMTGYTPDFAIGRKPTFLQGNSPSATVTKKFRENLTSGRRFTESIVNYRQNGEEYVSQISIVPLFNSSKILSHYLALENEVQAGFLG